MWSELNQEVLYKLNNDLVKITSEYNTRYYTPSGDTKNSKTTGCNHEQSNIDLSPEVP